MEGCKLTHAYIRARVHTHVYIHTEVDFSLQFVFTKYAHFS